MRALLDVNVVIALLDPDHAFHERARVWWAAQAKSGWASKHAGRLAILDQAIPISTVCGARVESLCVI